MKRWVVALTALCLMFALADSVTASGDRVRSYPQPYVPVNAVAMNTNVVLAGLDFAPGFGLVNPTGAPETIAAPGTTTGTTSVPCSMPVSPCGVVSHAGLSTGCGTPSYTTVYQPVSRTVCKLVPVTTEQEVTECSVVEVKTKEPRTEVIYKQVEKKEKVKQKVHKCVWVDDKVKVWVQKPVKKQVEVTYCTYEPKTTIHKQKYTVCVPVTKVEVKAVPYSWCEKVPVTKVAVKTSYVTIPVAPPCPPDPCAPACGPSHPTTAIACVQTPYCYKSYETVRKMGVHQYKVCSTEMQQQIHEKDVQVVSYEEKRTKKMVDVESCELVQEERPVKVMKTVEEEQEVEVIKCEWVKEEKKSEVEVITYKTIEKKVKKPVTTYQWQTSTVTECVPVQVPCQTAPAVHTLPTHVLPTHTLPTHTIPHATHGATVTPSTCCY